MRRESYSRGTIEPGHQPNARMSLIFPPGALTEGYVYIETFPTSKMRAEIQMRSGHLFWAKHRQTSEVIDVKGLFDDYWSSNKYEFTQPSQFWSLGRRSDLIENGRCRWYWKTPLVSGITILCKHDRSSLLHTAHPSQLIMVT